MRQRHRSFRLTQPEYMEGKRVKPRLRYLTYVSFLLILIVVFMCFLGSLLIEIHFGGPPAGWAGVLNIGAIIVMLRLVVYLTIFILRRLFVWLDLMTLNEAKSFPPPRNGWPENWLEPIPVIHNNETESIQVSKRGRS